LSACGNLGIDDQHFAVAVVAVAAVVAAAVAAVVVVLAVAAAGDGRYYLTGGCPL